MPKQPPPPPHRPVRRLIATACLVVFVGLLLATPTVFRYTPYDKRIRVAELSQDHQLRLLRESGASPEALDLHRITFQPKLDRLRIRRRVALYAQAATHFGLTLGFFLTWRTLRQPPDGDAAASTGSSASHSV